jgi:uncharacterized membrane protein
MYPKTRLDALSDAIFAVAMTLLVLDVRLPDDLQTADPAVLLRALRGLAPKFVPYVLSFMVLGLRWVANLRVRSKSEVFEQDYIVSWLVYHLLITCVPFTTIVLGRFPHLAPAVWLYAGNTILIALVGFRLVALTPELEKTAHYYGRNASLILLIVSSVVAIVWSLIDPAGALWALLLNVLSPFVERRTREHHS